MRETEIRQLRDLAGPRTLNDALCRQCDVSEMQRLRMPAPDPFETIGPNSRKRQTLGRLGADHGPLTSHAFDVLGNMPATRHQASAGYRGRWRAGRYPRPTPRRCRSAKEYPSGRWRQNRRRRRYDRVGNDTRIGHDMGRADLTIIPDRDRAIVVLPENIRVAAVVEVADTGDVPAVRNNAGL